MATSRKTLQLDTLQLNALNFKTTSNTSIPSSFVLYSVGDGTTSFGAVSSLTRLGYDTISVPGQSSLHATSTNLTLTFSTSTELFISTTQNGIVWLDINATSTITSTINSVITSTMHNILTYPNICSTILYNGNTGSNTMSLINDISDSGTAYFTSLNYDFTDFTQYINPKGSRIFVDYTPSFTFSQVSAPSSISSVDLYREGDPAIKNLISLSSYFTYNAYNVDTSAIQQYIPITSFQPFGYTTNTRVLSNTFIQPMTMELNSSIFLHNHTNLSLQHYLSDAIAYITTDVERSGFENLDFVINNSIGDRNSFFIRIINSGNES